MMTPVGEARDFLESETVVGRGLGATRHDLLAETANTAANGQRLWFRGARSLNLNMKRPPRRLSKVLLPITAIGHVYRMTGVTVPPAVELCASVKPGLVRV